MNKKKDKFSNAFITALKEQDIEAIRFIPKSDLHIHAMYGGSFEYLHMYYPQIVDPPIKFQNIVQMQQWQTRYIVPFCGDLLGIKRRIEGSFVQAKKDTIKAISVGVSIKTLLQFPSFQDFFLFANHLEDKYLDDSICKWELFFDKSCSAEYNEKWGNFFLSTGFFSVIDSAGIPELYGYDNLKTVYAEAKRRGMKTKIHIGEFEDANSILKALERIPVDEITHGISCVNNEELLEYLKINDICLNICPASNIKLGVSKDFNEHQIAKIYRCGVPTTINTDDLLLFGMSVSEQYLYLSRQCLLPEELDDIRINGLIRGGYYAEDEYDVRH